MSPSTRALLDAARASGPDAAAIARMRGKIDAAVAGAPAVTVTSSSTIASKLGLVALAVLVATGAIILATRSRSAEDRVIADLAEPSPAPGVRTVRESVPPAIAEIEIEMPATHARATKAISKAVEVAPITLAREVELVDRAMGVFRRGDARGALAAVRAYSVEAGTRGQLAEDAAAIEIEALCSLRDPAAASRRAAFDARWPSSAQRGKLARACSF